MSSDLWLSGMQQVPRDISILAFVRQANARFRLRIEPDTTDVGVLRSIAWVFIKRSWLISLEVISKHSDSLLSKSLMEGIRPSVVMAASSK